MPRTKGSKNKPKVVISVDEQITTMEARIAELNDQLKTAKAELKDLQKKKEEENTEKLLEAVKNSGKSVEEIITMIGGNADGTTEDGATEDTTTET